MWHAEHDWQLRQQIFLFSIGIFLVSYAISLWRYGSFEWAMLTSGIALVVTVIAGSLFATFVRYQAIRAAVRAQSQPAEPHQPGQPGTSPAGNGLDFTASGDGSSGAEAAAPA